MFRDIILVLVIRGYCITLLLMHKACRVLVLITIMNIVSEIAVIIFCSIYTDTGASKGSKSSKVKAKSSKMSKVIAMPIGSKKKKSGRGSGPSDGDSIMTEDFENQFHKVMSVWV